MVIYWSEINIWQAWGEGGGGGGDSNSVGAIALTHIRDFFENLVRQLLYLTLNSSVP